jgi:Uma2 family endonuclease
VHPGFAQRIHSYTYEAYLEYEASSTTKHEFINGDIYAMAGGTVERAIIAVNVSSSLNLQLRDSPCVVASSDLKVRVLASGMTTYPGPGQTVALTPLTCTLSVDEVYRNVAIPT